MADFAPRRRIVIKVLRRPPDGQVITLCVTRTTVTAALYRPKLSFTNCFVVARSLSKQDISVIYGTVQSPSP